MKRAGVIGFPLSHSLSPAIFQAAFDASGVDAQYEAWKTPEDELPDRIAGLRNDGVLGANVTIPHKEAVLPLLDRLDELAERTGAVNTIVNEGGKLAGYNTDVAGFARALSDDAGFDPKGKRVAILGGGGAARAVALALLEAHASFVLLTGRTPKRLDRIAAGFRPLTKPGSTITWTQWGEGVFLTYLPAADLVVNCTPVGTAGTETEGRSPIEAEFLPADGVVFDLVYNPQDTPLMKLARERGSTAVSGLGMLVYQAAESFRLWTGQDAPVERMLETGREALAGAKA